MYIHTIMYIGTFNFTIMYYIYLHILYIRQMKISIHYLPLHAHKGRTSMQTPTYINIDKYKLLIYFMIDTQPQGCIIIIDSRLYVSVRLSIIYQLIDEQVHKIFVQQNVNSILNIILLTVTVYCRKQTRSTNTHTQGNAITTLSFIHQ